MPLPTVAVAPAVEGTEEVSVESGISDNRAASEGAAADSIPEEPDSVVEEGREVSASRSYRELFFGSAVASVEERIFLADIIVRANLISAVDGVLRYRAIEYLKGTGEDEFSVTASTDGRDKQWDEFEAILFLSRSESGNSTGSAGGTSFEFADTTAFDYQPLSGTAATSYAGNLPEGYTVDSRNPVWLPLDSTTGTAAGGAVGGDSEFIAASSSVLGSAYPTVSLADLRSKIAWVEGGAGIEGYDKCIRASLDSIRYNRDWETYHGRRRDLSQVDDQVASGAGSGEVLHQFGQGRAPGYHKMSVTGPDADLFSWQIVDDDQNPANGFARSIVTTRPLPARTYRFAHHLQQYKFQPCGFTPQGRGLDWTVTVTAPTGTVHEALFDPADLSPGTGYSPAAGVLDPAGFSFGGSAMTVTGLKWEAGSVALTLSPYVSLSGQLVDFIALDGTVSLSLNVAAATADAAVGRLTWPVASQPWKAGDELMVRVRAADESAAEEPGSVGEAGREVSTIRNYEEFFFGSAVASVEERIFLADIIVRANLISAADGVLRYRAVEYLKGTGDDEFSVTASTDGRNEQWDGLEAVLFLSLSASGNSTGSAGATSYEFADTTAFDYRPDSAMAATSYAGNLPQGYTIDSRNPVWLPLDSATGTAAGGAAGGDSEFMTASASLSGAISPTISLAVLRSKIAWVEGGAGVEGYDECIRASLDDLRYDRDWEAYHGTPPRLPQYRSRIASGAGRGEVVHLFGGPSSYAPAGYDRLRVTGPDARLFSAQIVDDDDDPSNGFSHTLTTARPLPAGTYRADHSFLPYFFGPCGYTPPYWGLAWTVTVTAPTGTVHEALFDPADLSPGTGFSSSAGVLDPAGFTFSGTATTVTGLKWNSGSVVLTLSPYVSLSGQLVDFIALDGTVSLTLNVTAATADAAAGTLTWTVASQPWKAGDELMLRVRPAPPNLDAPSGLEAAPGDESVALMWDTSSNTSITGYEYQTRWAGVAWRCP